MAYIKTNWQDHVVEYTDRYRQEVNQDGTVRLTPDPGAHPCGSGPAA